MSEPDDVAQFEEDLSDLFASLSAIDRRPQHQRDLQRYADRAAGLVARAGHADPKIGLRNLASARAVLELVEYYAVYNAKLYEWSWDAIGEVLGMSRQAVHKRYAALLPNRRRRRPRAGIPGRRTLAEIVGRIG